MYFILYIMLTIYSLNANGLRNFEKIREIFTSCEIYNCDILCIQETFWNDAIIPEVSKLWEGKIFFNNYDISNRKGVAILMKKNINATIKDSNEPKFISNYANGV